MSDYIILKSESNAGLTEEVRKYIAKGYIPQGGVSVIVNMYTTMWVQAMYKA